jgi:hypothetical protein
MSSLLPCAPFACPGMHRPTGAVLSYPSPSIGLVFSTKRRSHFFDGRRRISGARRWVQALWGVADTRGAQSALGRME